MTIIEDFFIWYQISAFKTQAENLSISSRNLDSFDKLLKVMEKKYDPNKILIKYFSEDQLRHLLQGTRLQGYQSRWKKLTFVSFSI